MEDSPMSVPRENGRNPEPRRSRKIYVRPLPDDLDERCEWAEQFDRAVGDHLDMWLARCEAEMPDDPHWPVHAARQCWHDWADGVESAINRRLAEWSASTSGSGR